MLTVDVQRETSSQAPQHDIIERAVQAALSGVGVERDCELSLRIVDASEIQALNHQYRSKNSPTNVLSFPAEFPAELEIPLLGDIVICAAVVETEAREQHKSLDAHWDHMIVHGVLHLLGFDHEIEQEALEMEALEVQILAQLGWPSPYITAGAINKPQPSASEMYS